MDNNANIGIRLPASLKRQLAKEAAKEGRTLSNYLVKVLNERRV